MTTKCISLDLWEKNENIIAITQGEDNSRVLRVTLLDKSKPYNLTNSSVQFYMTKPDGNVVFNNATIIDGQNGIVEIEITECMCEVQGLAKNCELHIVTADEKEIKVNGINIYIRKAFSEDPIISSNEFLALNQALARCTQSIYSQTTSSNIWIVEHNLDKYPKVTVTDSNDKLIIADVKYLDKNTVSIYVNPACTGKVIIN